MRSITRCPACQTQFFVTESQLNKHDGKVRCGQCLHVFDAKAHFVEVNAAPAPESAVANASPPIAAPETPPSRWPSTDHEFITDHDSLDYMPGKPDQNQDQLPVTDVVELSANRDEIEAFTADTAGTEASNAGASSWLHTDDRPLLVDGDDDKVAADQVKNLNDITRLTYLADSQASIADSQSSYFGDLVKNSQRTGRYSQSQRRPWLIGVLALLFIAIAQSIYFMRDEIAIYYPNIKPYLVQACQQLGCSINLPKQIELIVIDDSDMQEDEHHAGLMRFSSSLINKAGFNQEFPNLELTLTDVDDNPVLRRIFKPAEYLPANTDIAAGFQAGAEIKIKLAITTQNVTVAGYRVYVTY